MELSAEGEQQNIRGALACIFAAIWMLLAKSFSGRECQESRLPCLSAFLT